MPREGERAKPNPWKRRVTVKVFRHRPMMHRSHPDGPPFAYCVCGQAIVHLSGVWWHLYISTNIRGRWIVA